MKRFAYLLANNDGLPGIKKDVADVRSFLISCEGGAWKDNDDEIKERHNIGADQVRRDFCAIRRAGFDYVFFYFSGHGDAERGFRLYLNREGEYIEERETFTLAAKQVSIFDCCRYIPPGLKMARAEICDEALNSAVSRRYWYRKKFDDMIEQATPQEIRLYACANGECAMATQNGSLYTQALLASARAKSKTGDASACDVHDDCSAAVSKAASHLGGVQNPDRMIDANGSFVEPIMLSISSPCFMYG